MNIKVAMEKEKMRAKLYEKNQMKARRERRQATEQPTWTTCKSKRERTTKSVLLLRPRRMLGTQLVALIQLTPMPLVKLHLAGSDAEMAATLTRQGDQETTHTKPQPEAATQDPQKEPAARAIIQI